MNEELKNPHDTQSSSSSLEPTKRQPYTPPILEEHGVWLLTTGGSSFEIQDSLPEIPTPGF